MGDDLNSSGNFVDMTKRRALYLWLGFLLAMTLFYVQSQVVFVHGPPRPVYTAAVVLSLVGLLTYGFARLFFKYYTKNKREEWRRLQSKDRLQQILVAFVLQWVLLETLGLYGVLLSVFGQNEVLALPFMGAAYYGFWKSFPRKEQISPFFR